MSLRTGPTAEVRQYLAQRVNEPYRPKLPEGYSYGKDISSNDIKVGDLVGALGTSRKGRYSGEVVKVTPKTVIAENKGRWRPNGPVYTQRYTWRKDELVQDKAFVQRGKKVHQIVS